MTSIPTDRTEILRTVLDGDPASKARARFTGQGSKTRAFTPEKTRAAEETWQWKLKSEVPQYCKADETFDYRLELHFYTATWQRRDLDNMVKLVSDACNGFLYKDDNQVTEIEASVVRADPNPRTEFVAYRLTPRRAPTTRCVRCDKPSKNYTSLTRKYCSRACLVLHRRELTRTTCPVCGDDFQLAVYRIVDGRTNYCSGKCRAAVQTYGGRPRLSFVDEPTEQRRARQRRWKANRRNRVVQSDVNLPLTS